MTIKQYIIDRLREFDPTLDLSDNSALVDLLVNPGAAMLDPVIAQLTFLMNNMGMATPETMDEGELDAVAANFLKTRSAGTKATGVVELFYDSPVNLDIPAGTTFTSSNGTVFETSSDIHIPKTTMAANTWNFPKYSTGTISVTAQEYGEIGSIPPNDITSTDLAEAPSTVTNPSAFTGGSDQETNTDFAGRLVDEVITGALGSADGIRNSLITLYPTIKGITVTGKDSFEMLRDLVYSGIQSYSDYTRVDFYGKVSGLNESPFPQSMGYWTVFYDDPTTSGITPDLPIIAEFEYPFTTDQYKGLYSFKDNRTTVVQTSTIFEDTFESGAIASVWAMSDATTEVGIPKNSSEFGIDNISGKNKLRLGTRRTDSQINDSTLVTIQMNQLYSIINTMYDVAKNGGAPSDWTDVTTYSQLSALAG
jgi:hypothetical protein